MKKSYIHIHGNMFLDLQKAKGTHKYIKRLPHPNPKAGRKWIYFYTQKQVKDFKEKGVIPGEEKKEKGSILSGIMNFFGFKSEKQAADKVNAIYSENKQQLQGVDKGTFADHMNEYLSNKEKWDARISGEKKEKGEKKEGEPKIEKPKSDKPSEKKEGGSKWNIGLMRKIAGIVGSEKKEKSTYGKNSEKIEKERENIRKKNEERIKEIQNQRKELLESDPSFKDLKDKYKLSKDELEKYRDFAKDHLLIELDEKIKNDSDLKGDEAEDMAEKIFFTRHLDIPDNFETMPEGKNSWISELEDIKGKDKKYWESTLKDHENDRRLLNEKDKKEMDQAIAWIKEKIKNAPDNFETMPEGELTEKENLTLENIKRADVSYREGRNDTFSRKEEYEKWHTPEGLKKLHNEVKKDLPNLYPFIDKNHLEKTGNIKLTEEGKRKFSGDKSAVMSQEPKDLDKKDFPESITPIIANKDFTWSEGGDNRKEIEFKIDRKNIKDGFELFGEKFVIAKNQYGSWEGYEASTGARLGSTTGGKTIKEAKENSIKKLKMIGEEKVKNSIKNYKKPELTSKVIKDIESGGDKKEIMSQEDENTKKKTARKRGTDQEEFVQFIKDQIGINLPNEKDDSLNKKKNYLYTEIPSGRETRFFSYMHELGINPERHMHNKYWIPINKEIIDKAIRGNDAQYELKEKEKQSSQSGGDGEKASVDKPYLMAKKEWEQEREKEIPETFSIDPKKSKSIKMPKEIKENGIGSKEYKKWVWENWASTPKPKLTLIENKPMQKASQLATGTKIESEHKDTVKFIADYLKKYDKLPSNKEIYESIAKDHIGEIPDYYARLNKMESEAESSLSKAVDVLSDTLEKGKAMPVGTVSQGRKKISEGKWVPVSDGKEKNQGGNLDTKTRTGTTGSKKKQSSVTPDKKSDKKETGKPEGKGKKTDDKKEQKGTLSDEHKGTIKSALKKMANILAEALSGRDVNQPTGSAIEQTGENLKSLAKPKQKTNIEADKKKEGNK